MFEFTGRYLAKYLQKTSPGFKPTTSTDQEKLNKYLQVGDVLLVEGNQRISLAIKYLTQSTWSHAAIYIGDMLDPSEDDPKCFIEADVLEGVRIVPLSKYGVLSTRICRPVGLDSSDKEKLVQYLTGRIGEHYDIKNAVDLIRYLLPQPPVPTRWRRRMLALGSGDPTRAICSTLIAQAFQSLHYPILPYITHETKQVVNPHY